MQAWKMFGLATMVGAGMLASSCGQKSADAPAPSTPSSMSNSASSPTDSSAGAGMAASGAGDTGATQPGAMSAPNTASAPSGSSSSEAPAMAPPPAPAASGASSSSLNNADRSFVMAAAGGGQYEVAAATLATQKASDSKVKDFAQMLVTQHSQANDELKQLADAKQVQLPAQLAADKQAAVDQLSKLNGAAFDRKFVRLVGLHDHKADITKFETADRHAKDPELKSWIEKTLPHLKDHLAQAQQLPEAVAAGSNSAKTSMH